MSRFQRGLKTYLPTKLYLARVSCEINRIYAHRIRRNFLGATLPGLIKWVSVTLPHCRNFLVPATPKFW